MFNSVKDKTKTFEAKIRPLMESVREECQKAGIPFAAAFELQQKKNGDVKLISVGDVPVGACEIIQAVGAVVRGEYELQQITDAPVKIVD